MGKASARHVADTLNQIINDKGNARLILATGTSQFYFLEQLQKEVLPWDKITVFHLDEYVGIADNHPASFRKYLKTRILDHVKPKKVFYLNGDAPSIHNEIKRYSNALSKHPINLACIGIGENGHLAAARHSPRLCDASASVPTATSHRFVLRRARCVFYTHISFPVSTQTTRPSER